VPEVGLNKELSSLIKAESVTSLEGTLIQELLLAKTSDLKVLTALTFFNYKN
jgi:hypothetical protein